MKYFALLGKVNWAYSLVLDRYFLTDTDYLIFNLADTDTYFYQRTRWPGEVPQSVNRIKFNNINRLSYYNVKTRLDDLGNCVSAGYVKLSINDSFSLI